VQARRLIDPGSIFAINLLAPRLAHRLRWHTRLGPGGTLAYALAIAAFAVLVVWLASKLAQRQEQMWAEVREHLGREPTRDEVFEYFHPHGSS
jgi:hypothetical protein